MLQIDDVKKAVERSAEVVDHDVLDEFGKPYDGVTIGVVGKDDPGYKQRSLDFWRKANIEAFAGSESMRAT